MARCDRIVRRNTWKRERQVTRDRRKGYKFIERFHSWMRRRLESREVKR